MVPTSLIWDVFCTPAFRCWVQNTSPIQNERVLPWGMFDWLLRYFLSKTCADAVTTLTIPLLHCTILYYMVFLQNTPECFFFFVLTILVTIITAQSFGMMISTATSTLPIAQILAPTTMILLMMFGGFYLVSWLTAGSCFTVPSEAMTSRGIVVWFNWCATGSLTVLYWCPSFFFTAVVQSVDNIWDGFKWIEIFSFMQYGFAALIINEFTDLEFACQKDTYCLQNGTAVIEQVGFGGQDKYNELLKSLALAVVFRFLSYLYGASVLLHWQHSCQYFCFMKEFRSFRFPYKYCIMLQLLLKLITLCVITGSRCLRYLHRDKLKLSSD